MTSALIANMGLLGNSLPSSLSEWAYLGGAMLTASISMLICANTLWTLSSKSKFKTSGKFIPLPQPPSYPLWLLGIFGGHTLKFPAKDFVVYLTKWVNHFKSDFEITFFGMRCFVMTHPDDIQYVLMERPGVIRRMKQVAEIFSAIGLPNAIFAAEGAQWGRLRRLTSSSFNTKNVREMIPTMEMLAKRMVRSYGETAAKGETIDVKETMAIMTFALTTLTGFEYDVKAFTPDCDQRTIKALVQYFEAIADLMIQPLNMLAWKMLPSIIYPKKRRFFENDRHIEGLISDVINHELNKRAAGITPTTSVMGHHGSMVKNMIASLESSGSTDAGTTKKQANRLTRADVIINMKFFFVAGRDTNGHTMSWAMYFLATHPDKQRKFQEEVDRILGDKEAPGTDEEVKALVYVNACYQETLRIRQPVPFTLLEGKQEFTSPSSGRTFPDGTVVLPMQAYVSLQEENFTDGKRFVPERWLDDEQRIAELGPNSVHKGNRMWPFGGGPRTCPGKDLATITSIVTLSAVFKRFNVEMDPYYPEPEFVCIGAMQPSQVHVKLRERSAPTI